MEGIIFSKNMVPKFAKKKKQWYPRRVIYILTIFYMNENLKTVETQVLKPATAENTPPEYKPQSLPKNVRAQIAWQAQQDQADAIQALRRFDMSMPGQNETPFFIDAGQTNVTYNGMNYTRIPDGFQEVKAGQRSKWGQYDLFQSPDGKFIKISRENNPRVYQETPEYAQAIISKNRTERTNEQFKTDITAMWNSIVQKYPNAQHIAWTYTPSIAGQRSVIPASAIFGNPDGSKFKVNTKWEIQKI